MATTKTTIANLALSLIGAGELTDLDSDTGMKASVCRMFYDQNKDFCLQFRPWTRALHLSHLVLANKTTVTGITQASPGVVTAASHGFSDGDMVTFASIEGMTEVNGVGYVVTNAADDTFELYDVYGDAVDTSGYGAFTAGGYCYAYGGGEWEYVYDLPSDCLQPVELLDYELQELTDSEYRREGKWLYTNQEYAALKYIKADVDPDDYDPELVDFMALRLAWLVCLRLTNRTTLWKDIDRRLTVMMVRAGRMDQRGARNKPRPSNLWVDAK